MTLARRRCINPTCGKAFQPLHEGHVYDHDGCWAAHFTAWWDSLDYAAKKPFGFMSARVAMGMRPLGFCGNAPAIIAFNALGRRLYSLQAIETHAPDSPQAIKGIT